MTKWGQYALIDEVTLQFKNEPEWWWKIKPPTAGDELQISKFLVQERRELGSDGVLREYPPTTAEIALREIALTFAGTNIPGQPDDPLQMPLRMPEPILKVGQSVHEIEEVLRSMPQAMVNEIWEKIAEACPGWGPSPRPKVRVPAEETR